ncbi:hypothetical protein M9458_011540, partial [Cirrhinus mrigala]
LSVAIFPCEYPLIELINLILYLNGTNFEVEEIEEDFKSRRPAPSGTCRLMPAHSLPGTPTYRTNSSDRLPSPKRSRILQSSVGFLSPEPPPAAALRSSPQGSHVASHINIEDIVDMALPLDFSAPVLSPESPTSPLLPSSPPESLLSPL